MRKLLVVFILACALSGCMATFVSTEYSANEVAERDKLRYNRVTSLSEIKAYDKLSIPVVVKSERAPLQTEGPNLGLLWMCSLGVIPSWTTETEKFHVSVDTPLGTQSGSCTMKKRTFLGWVPYLLPFSSSDGGEMNLCEEELLSRLVSPLKGKWVELCASNQPPPKEKPPKRTFEQVQLLQRFAQKESPKIWQTMQMIRGEMSESARRIRELRSELLEFGRNPDADEDYKSLSAGLEDLRRTYDAIFDKLEDAYIAAKKYEASPSRKDYQDVMKRALEDGIQDADMATERYKAMTRQK